MRINLLIKFWRINVFFMVSASQTIEAITSDCGDGKHYIFLDIENRQLPEVVEALKEIQKKYRLSDFWVVSDHENSFRAFCFSKRDWLDYLQIMLDLLKKGCLDYNFWFWTIKRSKATIRLSNKAGRPAQKVVAHLPSNFEEPQLSEKIEFVEYDTGLSKSGLTILIGKKHRGLTIRR